MEVSTKGVEFTARHEGLVLHAYADPVGILTIGYGFTNLHPLVREHFGGKLTATAVMNKTEAINLLTNIMAYNGVRYVSKGMPGAKQHEFDMGSSGTYNLGPQIFNWKWAKAYRSGDVKKAAALWEQSGTTAKGVRLAGLVRRRKEEARLLLHGTYGGTASTQPQLTVAPRKPKKPDPIVKEYQGKLKKLGGVITEVDGWMGPETEAAVREFQRSDPHLITDGILGRATRESIDRKLNEKATKRDISWTTIGTGAASVGSWLGGQNDIILYIVLGFVVVVAAYLLIKYRRRLEIKVEEILG